MRKIIFFISLFLLIFIGQYTKAEKAVYLIDGSKIIVQGTWEEGDKIGYFKDGKIYRVKKENVLKIQKNMELKRKRTKIIAIYAINLFDGRQFKTKKIYLGDDLVTYSRFGATISIEKSKIKEIIEIADSGEEEAIFTNDSDE